jgi:hypothetical protein
VHQSARGLHRDDGKRPANTATSSRGGDDHAERRNGGEARRRNSGEVGSSTRCTGNPTSRTRRPPHQETPTSRRSFKAAPRKPGGGDGAVPRQRSTGLAAVQGT